MPGETTSRVIKMARYLLSVVIPIYLGYRLNDYLARDKISIADVQAIPLTSLFPFPRTQTTELTGFDAFHNFRLTLYGRGERLLGGYKEQWNQSETQVVSRNLGQFIEYVDSQIARLNGYLTRVHNWKVGDTIGDILSQSYFREIDTNARAAINRLRRDLPQERSTLVLPRERAVQLKAMIDAFHPVRSGRLRVDVVLINRGNTDGLVLDTATLDLTEHRIRLPLIRLSLTRSDPNFDPTFWPEPPAVVLKRSMTRIQFEIDEGRAKPTDLDMLRGLLQTSNTAAFRVVLSDLGGDAFTSPVARFPPSTTP